MCGIVGLYLKNSALQGKLGALFAPMLIEMADRGRDSTGIAIYGDEVDDSHVKLTLQHEDINFDWPAVVAALEKGVGAPVDWFQNAGAIVAKVKGDGTAARSLLSSEFPDVAVRSIGLSIEILKDIGSPEAISEKFNIPGMKGTHAIGHTRMATESAVTTDGSHPFSTGYDLCLVHNGSLSNHNRLRAYLKKQGIVFETMNDSEVAAGYVMWRMQQGKSLEEALIAALDDLDGFYTLTVGTRDGFAVVRDRIACKPAILAETDDYVAMASEYRALASLPGIKNARLWEPEPGEVYAWGHTAHEGISRQELELA
ncbi:glutamine amidotransferase family protein [Kordiimonas lipolytica]|uniref:Glutamine amidotransferase family protein n=1 Tax=Kordiimonas lipolytica TaxID=1662421 RepID=A0ABV8UD58_9PROT|nr:glutamine amidotransferase family protein [Kordiimonas lipolytica]